MPSGLALRAHEGGFPHVQQDLLQLRQALFSQRVSPLSFYVDEKIVESQRQWIDLPTLTRAGLWNNAYHVSMQLPWRVLLLGGASGVGKTSISHRLAWHYGVGLTEVDDFEVVLEHFTDPAQYPVFHYWRLHTEEALAMDDEAQLDFYLRYAKTLENALALVIGNHLETHTPIVLEGDFILPSLALRETYGEEPANGQVRALFLYEEDEAQIAENFRERHGSDQPRRTRTSWWVNQWLRTEAERLGVPAIAARPWGTVLERAIGAVDGTLD
jgi:2-phosphoglycerate kinase